jgi:two-component system LytT family sensor kinase
LKTDKKYQQWRILQHVLFWAAWVVSFTIIQSLGEGIHEYFVWLMYYLTTLPVFVVHTYLIAYWLLPWVHENHNYLLFLLGIAVFLLVFSVIELVVSNELVFKLYDAEKSFGPGYLNIKNIVLSGIGNHFIILVFFAIKAGRSWYHSKNRKEELLRKKTETELEI